MNSIVCPAESTARYRYFHSVPTFSYLSSTRYEVPLILRCGRILLLISGAYLCTYLKMVTWSTPSPRSRIISSRSR